MTRQVRDLDLKEETSLHEKDTEHQQFQMYIYCKGFTAGTSDSRQAKADILIMQIIFRLKGCACMS